MISKSTKKNRRKMAKTNTLRSRLKLRFIDSRVDLWLITIQHSVSNCTHFEVRGKDKAIKKLRKLSSIYASKVREFCLSPKY